MLSFNRQCKGFLITFAAVNMDVFLQLAAHVLYMLPWDVAHPCHSTMPFVGRVIVIDHTST